MAYADFSCYQDVFRGSLIPDESTFRTFAERASEWIDTVTFDRLQDEHLLHLHRVRIQTCTCALAEKFFRRNAAFPDGVPNFEKLPKTSESIGAYSVSMANPYDYVQELSMTDAAFQKSLKSMALHYLGNTGLMFRGV